MMSAVKQRKPLQRQSSRYFKKANGLPRPKKTVSYSLPKTFSSARLSGQHHSKESTSSKHIQGSKTSSSNTSDHTVILVRSGVLLNLVHRRHKNQHRNQQFFKWVNLLRRASKHLVDLHQQNLRVESSTQVSGLGSSRSNNTSTNQATAEEVRRKFERQAELRSQRELHEEWMRETLVPNAYVAFTSLVSDEQFANLGVMLVGVLSDIASAVGTPKRIDKPPTRTPRSYPVSSGAGTPGRLTGTSRIMTGPDVGEVTERMYDGGDNHDVLEKGDISDIGIPIARTFPDRSHSTSESGRLISGDKAAQQDAIPGQSKKQAGHSKTPTNTTSSVQSVRLIRTSGPSKKQKSMDELPKEDSESTVAAQAHVLSHVERKPDKKKKKKKGGNVIDDLFSGFG